MALPDLLTGAAYANGSRQYLQRTREPLAVQGVSLLCSARQFPSWSVLPPWPRTNRLRIGPVTDAGAVGSFTVAATSTYQMFVARSLTAMRARPFADPG